MGLFRSEFEAGVADAAMANGHSLDYEADRLEYTVTRVYVMDFTLVKSDGSKMYIEAKGWLPPEDKRKILALLKAHEHDDPHFDFRMVLQKGHYKSKPGLYPEARWCNRNGIPWAEGTIPEEWFNE
jgi:hypothetical protein